MGDSGFHRDTSQSAAENPPLSGLRALLDRKDIRERASRLVGSQPPHFHQISVIHNRLLGAYKIGLTNMSEESNSEETGLIPRKESGVVLFRKKTARNAPVKILSFEQALDAIFGANPNSLKDNLISFPSRSRRQ